MSFLNIEIKARCPRPEFIRQWLMDQGARFAGTDQQTDTYFKVSKGRLKLREGNIENNLIYYERADQNGPKPSVFELFPVEDTARLKKMLSASLGIKVVVKKKREIYFTNSFTKIFLRFIETQLLLDLFIRESRFIHRCPVEEGLEEAIQKQKWKEIENKQKDNEYEWKEREKE